MKKTVVAIVVTFQPDVDILRKLIGRLVGEADSVIVIDNGSLVDIAKWVVLNFPADSSVYAHACGDNLGIAAAQNIGIAQARSLGCDYVIFFDQDSEPEVGMVGKLLEVAERMAAEGGSVACVGPRYFDDRQANPPPFIRIKGWSVERLVCVSSDAVVEVDYLISSGSLVPMRTIEAIGEMRADLFIDYVDIEWGLRAKSAGFRSFGVCAARMGHDLGDEPIEFRGTRYPARSPLRHYYMFRNAVFLYARTSLPLNWKVADGWRLVLKYFFYILFARPRLAHFRMMTLGVWDGLVGRMGKCSR